VNDPELFTSHEPGDYLFAAGRVNSMKRQHLLVEAMQFADSRVKLLVAGPPDSAEDEDRLRVLVELHGLSDRVRLDLRHLPRSLYADFVRASAGVAYLPYDEDSLSYVAMEAATAAKPILTASDSGGVLQLVLHAQTGWVAPPNPEALGEALSFAVRAPQEWRGYGRAAADLLESFAIRWPQTVEALLK
jgi:glycosyltransferase involved in cell wall biosynthesis